MAKTRIIFFGASEYSLPVLQKLLVLPDFTTMAVVTQPDRPVGRSQEIAPNPAAVFVRHLPLSAKVPLLQPENLDQKFLDEYRRLQPDLGLIVAYGPPFITPQIIDATPKGIINIHPSPLPRYRGAAPGLWQILKGESQSALSFFLIDPKPDHGRLIAQIPIDIKSQDTAASFYQRAFTLAADHLSQVLTDYLAHPRHLTPQNESQKSYFPRLKKDSSYIDWSQSPAQIDSFIRALYPYPIARTWVKNDHGQKFIIKIFSLDQQSFDKNHRVFRIIPNSVQIEGKKITSWSQIKNYYTIVKNNN